jgi:hypothetical protein
MATGHSNKIVGQTGEYLVAAELGRRGLVATTFTGNVPYYGDGRRGFLVNDRNWPICPVRHGRSDDRSTPKPDGRGVYRS